MIVSATDLVRAKPFAFTREQLNGVCVDPKSVPLAPGAQAEGSDAPDTPLDSQPMLAAIRPGRPLSTATWASSDRRCSPTTFTTWAAGFS